MSRKIINQYFDARCKAEGKVLSPRTSFTQALLDWLPNQEFDYEIIDQSRPALRCRVRKGGSAKSLVIIKRIKDGPLKRIKICSVGELPLTANKDVISVETECQRIMGELLKGESGRYQRAVTDTFANVLGRYIADTDLAKGSITNCEIVRDVYFVEWKGSPLRSITAEMCKKKFRAITNREVINKEGQQRGGPSAANTSMKVVRALFNFMAEESEEKGLPPFPASPTRALNFKKGGRKKKSTWNVEKERDGRINPDQLKAWWGATERLPEEY